MLLSRCTTRLDNDGSAVDAQILRSFVLQTPADHDSELVLDSFMHRVKLAAELDGILDVSQLNLLSLITAVFWLQRSTYTTTYGTHAAGFLRISGDCRCKKELLRLFLLSISVLSLSCYSSAITFPVTSNQSKHNKIGTLQHSNHFSL